MADGSAVVRPHNDVDQTGWTLWYYSPSTGLDYNLQGGEPYGGGGPDAHGALGLRSRKWEYKVGSRVLLGAWRGSREVTVDIVPGSDKLFDRLMVATDADARNQLPGELWAVGYGAQAGADKREPWVHTALVTGSESQSHHRLPNGVVRLTFLLMDGGWRYRFATSDYQQPPSRNPLSTRTGMDLAGRTSSEPGLDLASSIPGREKPIPVVYPSSVTMSGLPNRVDYRKTPNVQLSATVEPDDADDVSVQWAVLSGPATIDGSGLLTLTGAGTVEVAVASTSKPTIRDTGTTLSYDGSTTVFPTGVTVSGLPASVSLGVDATDNPVAQSFDLSAVFAPATCTMKTVAWSVAVKDSTGNSVTGDNAAAYATITSAGKLTVSKACTVIVTATSTVDSSVSGSASATVQVVLPVPTSITVTGVPDTVDADNTHSFTATPTITPSNADPRVSWTVDGPARVEVEDN